MLRQLTLFVIAMALMSVAGATDLELPPELEGWDEWVLHGEEFRSCPAQVGEPFNEPAAHVCAWPGVLSLDVTRREARFSQRWQVYTDAWLPLPGSVELWPDEVRIGDRAAIVVQHEGRPSVRVAAGTHLVTGRIGWELRPPALPVAPTTGLVALVIDGRRIALPERGVVGGTASVWLGERSAAAERSAVDLRVHRRLEDGIPGLLETRIQFAVAGPPREITLGPVLPQGYAAIALASDLPVRLESNQGLRIQLRRGTWAVVVRARAPGVVSKFELPEPETPWPPAETLSFDPRDAFRIVTIDGAVPVDPAQAGVPPDWHHLVAYVLTPGAGLAIVERSRGLADDAATRLTLARDLWLGFEHRQWLARDQLQANLSGRWRLEMAEPWTLESASAGGAHLLVTRSGEEGAGVELRHSNVQLDALATLPVTGDPIPITGWEHDLERADITVNLPPGHLLVAALGADQSRGDWVSEWSLLDIFIALLVTVAAFRLLGWAGAAVALPALVLAYHEPLAPTWLWVNLVLAVALVRALPEGRLRRWAAVWRALALVLMVVAILPFAFVQLRLALYPQLDAPRVFWDAERALPAAPVPEAVTQLEDAALTKRADEAETQVGRDLGYLPDTVVQTGPARPEWRYKQYPLAFSGPITPDQTMRLVIAPPWALAILRVLAVALSVLLLLMLAASVSPAATKAGHRGTAAAALLTAAAAWACALLAMVPATAEADVPPSALLEELKSRLTAPPACAPECAVLDEALVRVAGAELALGLELHAEAPSAFPLPRMGAGAELGAVRIDDRELPVIMDGAGQTWTLVEPGIARVSLTFELGSRAEYTLSFPRPPRRIGVSAPDFNVAGTAQRRLIGDTLSLTRKSAASTEDGGILEPGPTLLTFARVERSFMLGLDWTAATRVARVAPEKEGISLEVPLLPTESVTDPGPGVEIDGRSAKVSITSGRGASGWQSVLERTSVIELEAPRDAPWTEIWRIAAAPTWHVEFEGTPEIAAGSGLEQRTFMPRPGERLTIEVTRPEVVAGDALVVDQALIVHRPGGRAVGTDLDYAYRSTQGGRQVLTVPETTTLSEVRIDGRVVPLRQEDEEIAVPIEPGEHRVTVRLQTPSTLSTLWSTPAIDLGTGAGNVTTRIELPSNRWILWAGGSGVGPAILYWSELLAFLVLAVLVGRHRHSPLRVHEWLLLGLGLSTFSWGVLMLFAAWLFAMQWRARTGIGDPVRFNIAQVLLAVLGVIALLALLGAIPHGLLGSPDMRIAGPGSGGGTLQWFDDRIAQELPVKSALSVSIWWYKAAMLLWALWLSFALVRWVPWAWRAYSSGGYWRRSARRGRSIGPRVNSEQ